MLEGLGGSACGGSRQRTRSVASLASVSYAAAEAMCEARAPHRLVKPKPIHAKRAQKTSWDNPVMLAKLANAYVRAGGDNEKAARILGVTVGSARLAKRRHLDAPASRRARVTFGPANKHYQDQR